MAGWSRDASEVSTTAASLRTLGSQPGELGRWLLAFAAAGCIAYGFYGRLCTHVTCKFRLQT